MKKRSTLFIALAIAVAMLISSVSVFAGAPGWPGINGLSKDGGTINGKTSFGMHYYAQKKGTYKADLYKVNSKGSKVMYIRTVTFKCTKKEKRKSGVVYRGDSSFSKASKGTYYCLFPQTKGHNRSFYGKTKK